MTKNDFYSEWLKHFANGISNEDLQRYVVTTGNLLWHVFSWKLLPEETYLVGDEARRAYDAADKKDAKLIKKYVKIVIIVINLIILAVGLSLYENVFSLFPIAGVILHTSAFWITEEKSIRRVSFIGSPFWLVYNFISQAYGAALGSVLAIVSVVTAMIRYRKNKNVSDILRFK